MISKQFVDEVDSILRNASCNGQKIEECGKSV